MPLNILYATGPDGSKVTNGTPTEWITGLPTVTNADTLGVRPDLVRAADQQLGRSVEPGIQRQGRVAGRTGGRLDRRALALEARGEIKYVRQSNMTKAEIDKTIAGPDRPEEAGHFRAFWSSFDQSVNLMASGEVVIQSMWSPAVAAVRSRGTILHLSATEGRISRLGLYAWRDEACQRHQAGCVL